MSKISLILPLCVTLVSGCALSDGTETASEKPVVSAPVGESVTVPAAPKPAQVVTTIEPPAAPRITDRNEIRRLQMRLRDMGFDPGPIDGVAGGRTQAAFEHFSAGCARLSPLVDAFLAQTARVNSTDAALQKAPSREETLKLQNQLRSAGFNPGPADGIYGSRTKATVARLRSGCQMAKEFDQAIGDGPRLASNAAAVVKPVEPATAPKNKFTEAARMADSKPLADSQEEVRILQLRLRDAGFDPGPFDGIMGPQTKRALEQYEASQSGRKIKASLTTTSISGQY